MIYVLIVYIGGLEVVQIKAKKCLYFKHISNWGILFTFLLNLSLLIIDDFFYEEVREKYPNFNAKTFVAI